MTTRQAIIGRNPGLSGYTLITSGLLPHIIHGDITGTGGGARVRRARAVGVGEDEETRAAREFLAWCGGGEDDDDWMASKRAEIGAVVMRERAGWQALQTLARNAARNVARRLDDLRGVRPSVTSIEDAAADSVNACAARFPDGCLSLRNHTGARVRILRRIAGAAAWQSLSRWSVAGMTGRNGARVFGQAVFDVVKDTVAADNAPAPFEGYEGAARRAAARWVWRVGFVQFKASLSGNNAGSRATAIQGARRRCRVVSSVLLGQSLFDSCAVHGFGSVAAFVNSCERAGFFPALRAARARNLGTGAAFRFHRTAMRAAAMALRPFWGRDAARGRGFTVARGVRPFEEREGLLARAVFHRDAMRRAAQADLAAFDKILARLSDESADLSSLRAAFGITDKLGRIRNGSKVDGAALRRAKGSVQRPGAREQLQAIAPTVPLDVVTRYGERTLACAPLAPA